MLHKDCPPLPNKFSPLEMRICGDRKDSKFWEQLAKDAEKSNRFNDAYHYWLAAVSESRISEKIVEYNNRVEECLNIWLYKE